MTNMGILDRRFSKSALIERMTSRGFFLGSALTFTCTTIIIPFAEISPFIANNSVLLWLLLAVLCIAWLLSGLFFIGAFFVVLSQKPSRE